MSTPGQDSYAQQQAVDRLVANETVPSATSSIQAITSLLTLRKSVQDDSESKAAINSLLQSELKYLVSSSKALSDQGPSGQLLRQRFGDGLQAATALAAVMRSRQSQRVADKIIGSAMDKGGLAVAENETVKFAGASTGFKAK